jgi:hypothetical protein
MSFTLLIGVFFGFIVGLPLGFVLAVALLVHAINGR